MAPAILWPTFALVALVYGVLLTMVVQRFRLMRAQPPRKEDLASGEAAMRYFAPAEMPANNFRNLFEMPVLYFGLVPLLILLGCDSDAQAGLAWAYVLLRAVHSFIHIGPKQVMPRFFVYLLSCIILSAMWIGFAVDVLKR
jgi:hypothetical protein